MQRSRCNRWSISVFGSIALILALSAPALGQSGACCVAGACISATQLTCAGTFLAGSGCNPDPCSAVGGVCCRGATCNAGITALACTPTTARAGSSFVVSGTCNSAGSATTPCCYADYNKTGTISVQDVFDFLSDWFAGSPYARVGGDGTGPAPTVQSLFDFLAAWFAGGC